MCVYSSTTERGRWSDFAGWMYSIPMPRSRKIFEIYAMVATYEERRTISGLCGPDLVSSVPI